MVPVSTEVSNELTAGIWAVGTDIKAGNYSITGAHGGYGYVQIFEPNEDPRVYEVIGGEFSFTESDIQIKEGQKLRITGISMVYFQPND